MENISFSQKGWECPRCGRINAPWLPCCSCDKSTTCTTISWTQDTTLTNAEKDGERSKGMNIDDNTIAEAINDITKRRTWSHTYDNACMDGERSEE